MFLSLYEFGIYIVLMFLLLLKYILCYLFKFIFDAITLWFGGCKNLVSCVLSLSYYSCQTLYVVNIFCVLLFVLGIWSYYSNIYGTLVFNNLIYILLKNLFAY